MQPTIDWQQLLTVFFIVAGIGLALAIILIVWVVIRVRRINIPQDADVMTTLRATPLAVVLILDLLDMSLDFLSAPFSWVLLGYLGLKPLRNVTMAESLLPFTQFIPTMTAAWFLARLSDPARRRI